MDKFKIIYYLKFLLVIIFFCYSIFLIVWLIYFKNELYEGYMIPYIVIIWFSVILYSLGNRVVINSDSFSYGKKTYCYDRIKKFELVYGHHGLRKSLMIRLLLDTESGNKFINLHSFLYKDIYKNLLDNIKIYEKENNLSVFYNYVIPETGDELLKIVEGLNFKDSAIEEKVSNLYYEYESKKQNVSVDELKAKDGKYTKYEIIVIVSMLFVFLSVLFLTLK